MKTMFVTGAASGIGRATAHLFARRGFFVGCYDIDMEGAKATAAQIGENATHGLLDVTHEESWRTALEDFESAGRGALDVLFLSAGILRVGRFEDIPPAECKKQLEVNVMGVVLGIQAALPMLTRTPKSTIVTMSSASAIYGQPELAVYSATKFAVRALTEALDIEFHDRGIRVCDVMPGYVDTPMVRSQTHRAKTMDTMGVKLSAEDVADVVWKAVHGKRMHWFANADMRLAHLLQGLVPERLGRFMMRRIG
jgi:NAD(P)-dependent dehydrogenase (short-subunit alcohol dehydrogenase family)